MLLIIHLFFKVTFILVKKFKNYKLNIDFAKKNFNIKIKHFCIYANGYIIVMFSDKVKLAVGLNKEESPFTPAPPLLLDE